MTRQEETLATMTASLRTTLGPQEEIERRLRAIPALVNADLVLQRRGRLLDADILVSADALGFILPVRAGRVGDIEPASRLMRPWAFAIRSTAEDWLKHWQDPPQPGWHDILAMSKRGVLTIEGNLVPFMQNLQVVKDMLAAPRGPLGSMA